MENFLVLGIIPGTHVQINFAMWLLIVGIVLLAFNTIILAVKTLRRSSEDQKEATTRQTQLAL